MKYLCGFLLLISITANAGLVRLFYTGSDFSNSSVDTFKTLPVFKKHLNEIDIIAPQIYRVDGDGVIWGSVDSRVLKIARKNKIKIMPLIVNMGVSPTAAHTLLTNPIAQKLAAEILVKLCKKYHYYGIQFDLENIPASDADAYSQFYTDTATLLHKNGFAASIAVVMPHTTNLATPFNRWFYKHWHGVYDYKTLAKASDFITLMLYDQHSWVTTPGPIADIRWVNKTLTDMLRYIPANKISLGIPDYSGYWTSTVSIDPTDKTKVASVHPTEQQLGFKATTDLLNKLSLHLIWDPKAKIYYSIFPHNGEYEYLYIENSRTFAAKLALAKHYHLQGISVWRLGLEDPSIWKLL